MTTELMQRARAGVEAWQRGDVEALAAFLDPEVELTWWEPGDWDCHGREAVLAMLRERVASGSGEARIELLEAGEQAIVATRRRSSAMVRRPVCAPSTLISFRDGSVVGMRQFRDRSEALAAVR